MRVGDYIKELATRHSFSQSDLARETGFSRQILSYIISGKREMTISQALRLESLFNLKAGTLSKMQMESKIEDHRATLRSHLCRKLIQEKVFWSYDNVKEQDILDNDIIEKTFIHLDMNDIDLLFELYPHKYVRMIWDKQMAPQGEYLRTLNTMIARYYFGIKQPKEYLNKKERNHIKKLTKSNA